MDPHERRDANKMSLGKANAKTVAWKARVLLKLVARK
jgi:hypothetical protein